MHDLQVQLASQAVAQKQACITSGPSSCHDKGKANSREIILTSANPLGASSCCLCACYQCITHYDQTGVPVKSFLVTRTWAACKSIMPNRESYRAMSPLCPAAAAALLGTCPPPANCISRGLLFSTFCCRSFCLPMLTPPDNSQSGWKMCNVQHTT